MTLEREWERYEEVARQLINDVRDYLKLDRIEEKQEVKGYITNTKWEVDVIAYNVDDGKLVLVECKHKLKYAVSQESLAGFAYRIKDTNADHGIIVTTIGLQEGAEKIANAEKMVLIKLDYNATSENYIAQIANQIFIKMADRVKTSDCVEMKLCDKDGNLKDVRELGGLSS